MSGLAFRMRALTVPLVVSVTLALAPGQAEAQDAQVRAEIDTTLITVGDRVHLTVTVEHAPGSRVVWPDSLDLSPFEVLEARVDPPAARGDRVVSRAVMTLTSFELGELEVPSLDLTVEGADGAESVRTDRFGVEVVSVGLDEGGDIRGIRGPMALRLDPVRVGLGLVTLLLALAAALWLYRRFRKREGSAASAPAALPRPPHEVALEALDALAGSSLLVEGKVKEYHIAVSEILRRYVEDRFGVPALEMTTREIRVGLASAPVPDGFTAGLGALLDRCDLVKFAKVRPSADEARGRVDEGRALVRMTVPVEREVGEEGPGAHGDEASGHSPARALEGSR